MLRQPKASNDCSNSSTSRSSVSKQFKDWVEKLLVIQTKQRNLSQIGMIKKGDNVRVGFLWIARWKKSHWRQLTATRVTSASWGLQGKRIRAACFILVPAVSSPWRSSRIQAAPLPRAVNFRSYRKVWTCRIIKPCSLEWLVTALSNIFNKAQSSFYLIYHLHLIYLKPKDAVCECLGQDG